MLKYLVAFLLIASPVFADPDTAQLTRLINTLQHQRNQALDALALSDAKAAELTEKIKSLETELAKCKEGAK